MNYKKNLSLVLLLGGCGASICSSALCSLPSLTSNNSNNFVIKENIFFKNNDDVKSFFSDKHKDNIINIDNAMGKSSVLVDSYQQSNNLSYSTPKTTINLKYNTVAHAKDLFNIKDSRSFIKKLNSQEGNKWEYKVDEWWAKAAKRYMGNIVVMPFWAPEVRDHHASKIYSQWDSEKLSKPIKYLTDLIIDFLKDADKHSSFSSNKKNNILSDINNVFQDIINFIKNINSTRKLKSQIINSNDFKIDYVDFGPIKVKKINTSSISFKSDHLLPIVDYREKKECSGPTCSHNIRNLVDVVKTAFKDFFINNFESIEKFLSGFISDIEKSFVYSLIDSFKKDSETLIDKNLVSIVNKIIDFINSKQVISKMIKYINENIDEITFSLFGKLEKHGIQLGKCGNLVSGVKIESKDNVIKTDIDKPLILYSGSIYSIFNIWKQEYNYNSLYCIVELSNYKKLFNYLEKQNIPDNIKEIFKYNIMNQTQPSRDIFNEYLSYKDNKKIPNKYTNVLNSFRTFKNKRWKIPENISDWDVLYEYVIPSILSDGLYIEDNNVKQFIHKNYDFVQYNSDNVNANENIKIDSDNYSELIFSEKI